MYEARDICNSLADSAVQAGSAKGKVFLIEKLTSIIPEIAPQSPSKVPAQAKFFTEAIFPAVYRLLDEYMAGRGKVIAADLKTSIDRLVKMVFDLQGSALIDKCPSNKLSKVLEIVNNQKKLIEAQEQKELKRVQQEQLAHQQYLAAMEKADEEALKVVPEEPLAEDPGVEEPSKQVPIEFQSPKTGNNPAERQPFALIEAAHDEPGD